MDRFDIDQGEIVTARDRPKLTFEESSYTLPELLDSHLLPVVAQYDSTRQPIPFHEFNFDLSQPLLLYKKRHIQKVAARSLHIENEKYAEVGESLLIPEDYKGWFAVLQRITGNTTADDNVAHFKSVDEIANSNTDRFLIGGTKKISGLELLERSDTELKHEQRHFHPGDILTREKIYYGETRKRTRLFRKPKYITEKFLMCRDEADHEILLPFEQTGIFYQISHRSGKPNRHVMQMSDIVARKLTPRIIKLVFGRFPVTPCSFTGLMKAESSRIETSIIASTLINKKNILMEIPVSSAIYFRVAVMNNDLRRNVCYRNAMSLCAERAITYMRNIKVCYNFTLDDDFEQGDQPNEQNLNFLNQNMNDTQSSGDILNYINNNNIDDDQNKTLKSFQRAADDYPTDVRRGNSVDIPEEVSVRPGRSLSTGRMSFCLGNSYLTIPMFEPGSASKRNSGNNNTSHDMIYTLGRGSKLSFNGTFFEEEADEENEIEEEPNIEEMAKFPPPLACTNISSYVNAILPPTTGASSEFPDYIPTSGSRRPSTQPPEMSPPPLPGSSSTSGVSSGSLSSVSDETIAKRLSSESFEYAVPKLKDPNTILSDLSEAARVSSGGSPNELDKPRLRRPSTFTFSEGCFGPNRREKKHNLGKSLEDDQVIEDSSPIYENIQKLMELVAKLENQGREDAESIRGSTVKSDQEDQPENIKEDCSDIGVEVAVQDSIIAKDTAAKKIDINNPELDGFNLNNNAVKKIDIHNRELDGNNLDSIDEDDEMDISNKGINSLGTEVPVADEYNDPSDHTVLCENVGVNEQITDTNRKPKVRRKGVGSLDNAANCLAHAEQKMTNGIIEQNDDGDEGSAIEASAQKLQKTEVNDTQIINNGVQRSDKEANASVNVDIQKDDLENVSEIVARPCVRAPWKEALDKMKTSDEQLVSRGKIREIEKPFSSLDVEEMADALFAIGIKEATIEHIKTLGVDGAKLSEVLDGEVSIRDCLVGVNLVEQQKISMFLRGWRPNCE